MTLALVVVITLATLYIAHLLGEIRGELRAINNNIHPIDLNGIIHLLDSIEINTRENSDSQDVFGNFKLDEGS
jgi:hypothetical protein